jgi:hypothetical protein
MTVIVIVLAVALAFSFVLHFLNAKDSAPRKVASDNRPAEPQIDRSGGASTDSRKLEGELDKKRKEIDELKTSQNELKAELKDVKKKLYEAKESGKADHDLVAARAAVEHQASIQLDATRAELSVALAELTKLKAEAEGGKKARKAPEAAAPAPAPVAAAPAPEQPAKPVEQVVVQKVIRELNDQDKAKMAELEQKAAKARYHEIELERELKTAKGRAESQSRQLRESRKEATLAKDKFRAVEARLNRTLLERDMTVRALRALEKASGQTAERIELTADEIAESDRKVAAQQAAQEKVEAEARAKLEVEAQAAEARGDVPAPAPSAPSPVAPTTTPTA